MADKAGYLRRILDYVPGLVVKDHLNEDVPGEKLAAGHLARAALAELLDPLDRHQHLANSLLHVERADSLLKRGLGLMLVARIGMDNIPFHRGLGSFGSGFSHGLREPIESFNSLAQQH